MAVDLTCGICHDADFREQGELDCCLHIFCHSCISKWASIESKCPFCKLRFKTITRKFLASPAKLERPQADGRLPGTVVAEEEVPERDQRAVFEDPTFAEWIESLTCIICGGEEDEHQLLLCDGCDSAAHTYCLGLDDIPEGDWFCASCRRNRDRQRARNPERTLMRQRRREDEFEIASRSSISSDSSRRRRCMARREAVVILSDPEEDDVEDEETEIEPRPRRCRRENSNTRGINGVEAGAARASERSVAARGGARSRGNRRRGRNDDLEGFIISDDDEDSDPHADYVAPRGGSRGRSARATPRRGRQTRTYLESGSEDDEEEAIRVYDLLDDDIKQGAEEEEEELWIDSGSGSDASDVTANAGAGGVVDDRGDNTAARNRTRRGDHQTSTGRRKRRWRSHAAEPRQRGGGERRGNGGRATRGSVTQSQPALQRSSSAAQHADAAAGPTAAHRRVQALAGQWDAIRAGSATFDDVLLQEEPSPKEAQQRRRLVSARDRGSATSQPNRQRRSSGQISPFGQGSDPMMVSRGISDRLPGAADHPSALGASIAASHPPGGVPLSPPLLSLGARLRAELAMSRQRGSQLPPRMRPSPSAATTTNMPPKISGTAASMAEDPQTDIDRTATPRYVRQHHHGASPSPRLRTVADFAFGATVARRRTPPEGAANALSSPPWRRARGDRMQAPRFEDRNHQTKHRATPTGGVVVPQSGATNPFNEYGYSFGAARHVNEDGRSSPKPLRERLQQRDNGGGSMHHHPPPQGKGLQPGSGSMLPIPTNDASHNIPQSHWSLGPVHAGPRQDGEWGARATPSGPGNVPDGKSVVPVSAQKDLHALPQVVSQATMPRALLLSQQLPGNPQHHGNGSWNDSSAPPSNLHYSRQYNADAAADVPPEPSSASGHVRSAADTRSTVRNPATGQRQKEEDRDQQPQKRAPASGTPVPASPGALTPGNRPNVKQRAYDLVKVELRTMFDIHAISRDQYKQAARAATKKLYGRFQGRPEGLTTSAAALAVDEVMAKIFEGKNPDA